MAVRMVMESLHNHCNNGIRCGLFAIWRPPQWSGTEKQPEHKVFGRDTPGTSGTQTSGYPGQELYQEVAFVCCFRQEVAWMSRDLGRDIPDLEKLSARKLWADFSLHK